MVTDLASILEPHTARMAAKVGTVVIKYVGVLAAWLMGHIDRFFGFTDYWLDQAIAA